MPNNNTVGILAKVFYVITIMGSFVLVIQPIFHVIERSHKFQKFLEPHNSEDSDENANAEYEINSPFRMMKYLCMRSSIVALTTLGSFVFPNLNVMLALGGSVIGTCMTIIMPVMFYNRAYSQEPKHLKMDKSNRH